MIKSKKSATKMQDSPPVLSELARAGSPRSASPMDAPVEAPAEGSSSSILEAIRRMKNLNTRFDNLESALAGVKSSIAANSTHITNLEETREDQETRLADLEKVCDELQTQSKLVHHPGFCLTDWMRGQF